MHESISPAPTPEQQPTGDDPVRSRDAANWGEHEPLPFRHDDDRPRPSASPAMALVQLGVLTLLSAIALAGLGFTGVLGSWWIAGTAILGIVGLLFLGGAVKEKTGSD